jgi:KaiC/GvpD/RAD55 family RecA-like ATPase
MGVVAPLTKRKGHEDEGELQRLTLDDLFALDLPEPQSFLAPWLTDCHLCMVYSASGVGKSFFTLSVALAVAGGGEFLGWKADRPRKVLIVDGEMDLRDLKARAKHLLPAIGGDAESIGRNLTIVAQQGQDLSVEFPDLGTDEGQTKVLDIIEEEGPELIILDNFSTLVEVEDENAAASFNPIMKFMRRLKQDGKSVILVHHSRKDDKSWRGSQKLSVLFNSIIHLQKPEGRPSVGPAEFAVVFEKFRGDTRGVRDLEVSLGDQGWTHRALVTDQMAQLLDLLRSLEHSTQASLAEALGVRPYEVSRLKAAAIRKGVVTRDEWDQCLADADAGEPAGDGQDY